jgi:hypothetical protein
MVTIVLPLEGNFVVFDGEKPPVGKSDPMGVAAKVFESLLRAPKGRLGIDHPFAGFLRHQALGKGNSVLERLNLARKKQLPLIERVFPCVQKESPEQARQDFHRKKEAGAACDPAFVVRRSSAAGYDAVYVGVMVQVLPPVTIGADQSCRSPIKNNRDIGDDFT